MTRQADPQQIKSAIRVEPMLHLESSLLHIAPRLGPACSSVLQTIDTRFMNLVQEESPPKL